MLKSNSPAFNLGAPTAAPAFPRQYESNKMSFCSTETADTASNQSPTFQAKESNPFQAKSAPNLQNLAAVRATSSKYKTELCKNII